MKYKANRLYIEGTKTFFFIASVFLLTLNRLLTNSVHMWRLFIFLFLTVSCREFYSAQQHRSDRGKYCERKTYNTQYFEYWK